MAVGAALTGSGVGLYRRQVLGQAGVGAIVLQEDGKVSVGIETKLAQWMGDTHTHTEVG